MPLKSLSFIFIAFNCIYFRASLLGHCLFSIFHFRPFCGLLICRRVFARLFYLAIYFTHCHFPSGRFVFWWLLFLIFGHYERTAVRRSRSHTLRIRYSDVGGLWSQYHFQSLAGRQVKIMGTHINCQATIHLAE